MKYYIYISDAKVDMLFPQVPHDIKKKVALEFKMDLKLLSASRRTETESEDNRVARLETVVDFITQYGSVGTVDNPEEYIKDTLTMRWGPYNMDESNGVVYFGGKTQKTTLGMGGSLRHVIGSVGNASSFSASAAPFLLNVLSKELGTEPQEIHASLTQRPDAESMPLRAVEGASEYIKGPEQKLEFLSKRLMYGESSDYSKQARGVHVLLATPLYVTLAD